MRRIPSWGLPTILVEELFHPNFLQQHLKIMGHTDNIFVPDFSFQVTAW